MVGVLFQPAAPGEDENMADLEVGTLVYMEADPAWALEDGYGDDPGGRKYIRSVIFCF